MAESSEESWQNQSRIGRCDSSLISRSAESRFCTSGYNGRIDSAVILPFSLVCSSLVSSIFSGRVKMMSCHMTSCRWMSSLTHKPHAYTRTMLLCVCVYVLHVQPNPTSTKTRPIHVHHAISRLSRAEYNESLTDWTLLGFTGAYFSLTWFFVTTKSDGRNHYNLERFPPVLVRLSGSYKSSVLRDEWPTSQYSPIL